MAKKLTEEQAQKFADITVWEMIKSLRHGVTIRQDDTTKYPWTQWTDGEWWMIRKDDDFEIPTSSMRSMLMTHAKRHSMTVQVIKRLDLLTFRFADKS